MARYLKIKKESIGLSPDSLVFRGEKKHDNVRIRLIDYDTSSLQEQELSDVSLIEPLKTSETVSWINIDGLHDSEIMKSLCEVLDLDQMMISNVLNTHARPMIREYKDCVYISMKMLQLDEATHKVSAENFVLILKENILLTFQERVGDVFEPVRNRLRNNKRLIRNSGVDYLAFSLMDVIIDHYTYVISQLGEKIEMLDEKLALNSSKDLLNEMNMQKREINYLRKCILPAKEMLNALQKIDLDIIADENTVHFRELQNNFNLAFESIEIYKELLNDHMATYNTQISNRLNDIMKFLTIFSVVFIPLTFMAGIYGMNFQNMPELKSANGYYILLGIMLIVGAGMLYVFKRKKWL